MVVYADDMWKSNEVGVVWEELRTVGTRGYDGDGYSSSLEAATVEDRPSASLGSPWHIINLPSRKPPPALSANQRVQHSGVFCAACMSARFCAVNLRSLWYTCT